MMTDMRREEFLELVSPERMERELAARGREEVMGLMNEMARVIEGMGEGQYIDVGRVREENRALFCAAARDAMMCNNRFYFNDEYTRFYRARMDAEGNAVLEGSCG